MSFRPNASLLRRRSGHPSLLLSLLVAIVPARAAVAVSHDTECGIGYECVNGAQAFHTLLFEGWELVDDVHCVLAPSQLCAVDMRLRPFVAGTVSVVVYEGSADDAIPGAVLAGPVELVVAGDSLDFMTYHVEFPPTEVPQDLWVGVRWLGAPGTGIGVVRRNTVTVGTSHDLWYFSDSPTGPFFHDNGADVANLFLRVYARSTTPTVPATWGAVKGGYR